jgi:hypothetical protein
MSTARVITTLLTLAALALLLSLRFVGLYSHQVFAAVLVSGLAWAGVSMPWLARRGRLHTRLLREWR